MVLGLDSRTMALALKKPMIPIAEAVCESCSVGRLYGLTRQKNVDEQLYGGGVDFYCHVALYTFARG